ncbi:acetyltransferase (GNAT) family protein [Cupriavidus gilardii J11]|uniref:Acetyltransferase (GNAT) family protein n=1 Tax=Cupriavidus gilardii J11 TaxID=936133 RepID=A0A562BMH0_9BURK|nr:GNAT family N-acetyltransferase [Cupriavidus gilardii]TWG86427.1 acetyltransferase (GNAT) family protein [Cupriavidus gilardii J11]
MIEVRPYQGTDEAQWNALVARSRTGSFLHDRRYMDYHADRFVDASLIIEQDGKPVAVLPASRHGDEIVSHGGLTYGGILASADLRAEGNLEAMQKVVEHYRAQGVRRLVYKAVPHVFHRYPCEEDLYSLFRCDARLFRRDISSVIELAKPYSFSKGRKWSVNKSRKTATTIAPNADLTEFHALLTSVVARFGVKPTHSLDELVLLQSRFPDNIVLHEARCDGQLLAGTVIYDFGDTVHTQYMASSDEGREQGALDHLIADLIAGPYRDRRYFSFGISTEQAGTVLNGGLVGQKEGFGARAIVHDFYEILL